MTRALLHVQGKHSSWVVISDMSDKQIESMRADGIEVGIVENSIPAWAVEAGMLRPWIFVQDVWSFRNPFRG